MPMLVESKTPIKLAPAKSNGLNELGVPVLPSTAVKKGKLQEFAQLLEGGQVGRRFQNLRVSAVKTTEGGVESAKLFVQFEVFGDDNVPLAEGSGFQAGLYGGGDRLLELPPAKVYLPYARFWYENQFVFEINAAVFDRVDQLEFVANADQVRVF